MKVHNITFVLFTKLVTVIILRGHKVILIYLFFIFVVSVEIGAEE